MIKQRFILPRNVKYIISELNKYGYRADIVGGCVRDILLAKEPFDYDITTNALPNEMKNVFSHHKVLETGIKHGTLTVIVDGVNYEITTYRLDGEYTDNRHPDSVLFTGDISLDLSRRDFTVNAMCYNDENGLTDLFGGIADLKNGIIRAVGEPRQRFQEDALRIVRALRFASTLDFKIESKTSDAIRECAGLLANVSSERIFTEWQKLIAGKGAHRVISEFSDIIGCVVPMLNISAMPDATEFENADSEIRELSLFALSVGEGAAQLFDEAMRKLKSDNKHRLFGVSVLNNITADTDSRISLIHLLIKGGVEVSLAVIKLKALLNIASPESEKMLVEILNSDACYKLSKLKVNGNDMRGFGLSGKEIGQELDRILLLVAEGKLENEFDKIKDEVTKARK